MVRELTSKTAVIESNIASYHASAYTRIAGDWSLVRMGTCPNLFRFRSATAKDAIYPYS